MLSASGSSSDVGSPSSTMSSGAATSSSSLIGRLTPMSLSLSGSSEILSSVMIPFSAPGGSRSSVSHAQRLVVFRAGSVVTSFLGVSLGFCLGGSSADPGTPPPKGSSTSSESTQSRKIVVAMNSHMPSGYAAVSAVAKPPFEFLPIICCLW